MPTVKTSFAFDSKAALNHFRYMAETKDKRFPGMLRSIGVTALEHQRLSHRRGIDPETGLPQPASGRSELDGGVPFYSNGLHIGNRYRAISNAQNVEVYNDFIGARVHHEGLTIRPKNAKFLAIPILENLKISERSMRPRQFDDTRVAFRRSGGGVILQRIGRGPKKGYVERAIFILVRSAKIPRRRVIGLTTAVKKALTLIALRGYFPGGKP